MLKSSRDILKILGFVFISNFFWEISQMPLYQDHTQGLADFIFVHLKASLGDILIFFLIYVSAALILKSKKWFLNESISKYFMASLIGFALATAIEKYALSTGRWAYNDLMPIIPFFKVGLLPILQMVILPAVTLFFLNKNNQK